MIALNLVVTAHGDDTSDATQFYRAAAFPDKFDERAPTCCDALLTRSFVNRGIVKEVAGFFSSFPGTFTVAKRKDRRRLCLLAPTINIQKPGAFPSPDQPPSKSRRRSFNNQRNKMFSFVLFSRQSPVARLLLPLLYFPTSRPPLIYFQYVSTVRDLSLFTRTRLSRGANYR